MIEPNYLTVDELLAKRLFRIPDYQRAYSWKKSQRDDLFKDIQKLRDSNDPERSHFLATIVLMKTSEKEEVGPDEFFVYDIVDGQQRLTTLVILLKAITKQLLNGNDDEKRYGADLQSLLVKRDNDRLILLQTNHESAHEFRQYLVSGVIPRKSDINTSAQLRLADAFNNCEHFVQNWPQGATDLLRLIKNRLAIVNYVLEDQASAYTIFEVLNSRGLAVDSLDKCKSMLMALAYESFTDAERSEFIGQIHQLWTSLYREIGVDEVSGNEILRFTAALLSEEPVGKIMSDDEALNAIRISCQDDTKMILKTVAMFVELAKVLKGLNGKPSLNAVVSNRQSRFLYTAIILTNHLKDRDKEQILDLCERVTFLIYGIFRRDTRYEVGALVKLAWNIVNERSSSTEIMGELCKIGSGYIDNRSSIMAQLCDKDCYNQWQEPLRYLLYKYEAHLAERAGYPLSQETWERIWAVSPARSIEHVLPQDPSADEWIDAFSSQDEAINNCHRLGNLIILPPEINSSLGKLPFHEKLPIYRECTHLRMVREITEYEVWNKEKIDERELQIAEWAEEYWKIEDMDDV